MHIVAANMVLFISTRSKLSSNRGSASSLTLHASRSGFACGNTILVAHLSKNTLSLTDFMTKLYKNILSLDFLIVGNFGFPYYLCSPLSLLEDPRKHIKFWGSIINHTQITRLC